MDQFLLSLEINFYFALCGLPIAIGYLIYSGEITHFAEIYGKLHLTQKSWFLGYIALSATMGMVITLSLLMANTVAGPISVGITSIIGSCCKFNFLMLMQC